MSKATRSHIPEEWVDEIPTRPSGSKALVVSLATAMLAGPGLWMQIYGPPAISAILGRNPDIASLLQSNGLGILLHSFPPIFGAVGMVCGAVGVLSLLRNRASYRLLRATLLTVYPLMVGFAVFAWIMLSGILSAKIRIDGAKQDRATIIKHWWDVSWPALAVTLYVAWLHVLLFSRSVYAAFTGKTGEPMAGDRILEDVRTHGRDPRSRRSLYNSALTHLTVLIIIPYLLRAQGCVENYRVPKGSGNPVVAMVKVAKPKKKKKKKLHLRPNSAIIFEVPDLDDTEVDQIMDQEMTVATYVAQANAKAGKMGKGGGTEGGWPAGMDNYKIRFIRLDHGGSGWDDGMKDSGADVNFLRAFARATGFKKIARKGESHEIALLAKYADDGFPPFVYMTGNGNIGRVSSGDIKILREYCLKGGMLIGDAGSGWFDRSFRHFIHQVFPDKRLIDIADDDMIYQLPYGFPNGAPAFWHHGGRRALGIKHEGRWVCFYHPGDMNDAWKSPGYSSVTPEMKQAAMNLGINLVYYAFNQWDDAVTKIRK
jgi:hypothetical protein